MSSRKILLLAIALPTLGAAVYSIKYSGKVCGGVHANLKEQRCPSFYECVLESDQPAALGVCRFLPNGLRLWPQPPQGNELVVNPPQKDPEVEYALQTQKAARLAFAQNKFGFELLKTAVFDDQTAARNVVLSPTSLGQAFALLYTGAAGPTKDQLANVLQIPGFSLVDLNDSAQVLMERLTAPVPGIQSVTSNSLWLNTATVFNNAVIQVAQGKYNTYITNLDFADPQAVTTINNWVSGNTGGKVPAAVSGPLAPKTASYIVNTAYFTGVWRYAFDSSKTATRDFYNQDGTTTPMAGMKMENVNLLYFENDLFQAVKLPYGKEQLYSMVVLLPKESGIVPLLSKFDMLSWQGWLASLEPRVGTLYLPKFKAEYAGSMARPLKSMGLTLPFAPGAADFASLSADGQTKSFFLDTLLHTTYIAVTEEGTEAAVWAAEETATDADPPASKPFTMDVNKPFMFAVVNEQTQANVLVGIVRAL
jgi:serpin B